MAASLTPPPLPAAPDRSGPSSPATGRPDPATGAPRSAARLVLCGLCGLKSWLLATLCCLALPLAIVFTGWTCRLVQRRALARWGKALGSAPPCGRLLPRWILSEEFRADLAPGPGGRLPARIGGIVHALVGSLAANAGRGALAVSNSMIVTLPGGVLMLLSWNAGWNNSFHKGYEQAAAGPLWGLAGIALFIAAMTYLPLAQARQAVTGSARAFWSFGAVRAVIARRPLSCLLLVAGYTVLGLGFTIAVSALTFVGNADRFAEMTAPQLVAFLNSYYFWWAALFVVPGFLALKLFAGRLYAGATLEAVRAGERSPEDLAGVERTALAAVPRAGPKAPRRDFATAGRAALSAAGRLILRTATFLLLLTFAIELYVAQFFNVEPAANWLRHPLVQLPWFHSIPAPLRD